MFSKIVGKEFLMARDIMMYLKQQIESTPKTRVGDELIVPWTPKFEKRLANALMTVLNKEDFQKYHNLTHTVQKEIWKNISNLLYPRLLEGNLLTFTDAGDTVTAKFSGDPGEIIRDLKIWPRIKEQLNSPVQKTSLDTRFFRSGETSTASKIMVLLNKKLKEVHPLMEENLSRDHTAKLGAALKIAFGEDYALYQNLPKENKARVRELIAKSYFEYLTTYDSIQWTGGDLDNRKKPHFPKDPQNIVPKLEVWPEIKAILRNEQEPKPEMEVKGHVPPTR